MAKKYSTKHDREFAEIRALLREAARLSVETQRIQKRTKAGLARTEKKLKALGILAKRKGGE